MPHALDSGDRKLLIVAGVLLVLLVIASAFLSPREMGSGRSPYPSSYSAKWDGAKGAFLLLKDLGYNVERWEQSPLELDSLSPEVLILASPIQPVTPEEKAAVADFLRGGGRIVATGWAASRLLPQSSLLSEGFPFGESVKFPALIPSPIVRGAPKISMIPPEGWHPRTASELVVYGTDDTAAVVTYDFGKGKVIWWGSSSPLTNAGLRQSGNLGLLLNSVGPPGRVRVLWDEYFHGSHGSLLDYLGRTPLYWGALQFALVFLAILATFSRRHGPISTPIKPSRLSPLEFVETLGDLYLSAHAGSAAVRIADQRLRFQLSRQLGLPANASNADLASSAAKSLSWNEREFADVLARADVAMKNTNTKDAETLQIVQQIFDYTGRLELRRPEFTERPSA
ncbi:MAG TPA: DUF4350 domain-containing protein [Candidatus Eisenbacteria bacterium]|jgi:hypothetical protein|nr:DUF4350 domain-containing protein [Candidatus Eisenbacteria bacterium]